MLSGPERLVANVIGVGGWSIFILYVASFLKGFAEALVE
jgi:hypothetical protein